MSTSRKRRKAPLVRANHQGLTRRGEETEKDPVRRGGVLQPPEQHETEDVIPVEFLLAYVQALIRNNPSRDLHVLSVAAAKSAFPITEAQEEAFLKAVGVEARNSHWPKGFF